MYEDLEGLFASNFAVQTEVEADRLINEQKQLWIGLLQKVREGLHNSGENQALMAIDHLSGQIMNMPGMFLRPHDVNKGFVVSGKVPIVTRSGTVIDRLTAERPYDVMAAILVEGGDELQKLFRSTGLQAGTLNALFGPFTQMAITRYYLAKAESGLRQQLRFSVEGALADHEAELRSNAEASSAALAEIQAKNEQLLTKFNEVGLEANNALDQLRNREAKRIEEAALTWAAFQEKASQDIEAAKALAFEGEALKTARQIWAGKKWKHSLTFALGLAGLALVICGGIGALVWNWQTVLSSIPRNNQGEPISSFLVFIVVPVVGVAWVLRIFARWITNSLTLGEDAEQRRAMLETYFSLVGNKDAKMEQSDRILILNAIFRPLPGHQTEDVAPPTLLDLTKDALAGKKN